MVNKKRVSKVLVFVLLIGTLLSSVAFAADVDTTDWVVAEDIKIKTTAHIQKDGDKDFSGNGQIWFGTTGEKKRVEEISIGLEGEVPEDMRIMYMAHVQKDGDTKWTEGPNPAGTHGEAKRIEGIAIKLVDEAGKEYPGYVAEYQVHMAQYGWGINETKNDKNDDNKINDSYKEWASNGTYAGTRGEARRIEAVRLRIRREDELKVKSVSAINPTTVKVVFNKEVEELAKADVVVTNVKTSEKQYVKEVKLAEDKKSAEISFYDALATKNTYKVVAAGAEKEFDFVIGDVAKIEAKTVQVVPTEATAIEYKVLDANGLDITATTDVTFESTASDKIDKDGKITLADKETAFVYVVYTDKDGNKIKSNRITVKAEAAKPAEISDYTVAKNANFDADDYKQNLVLQKGATEQKVHVLVKDQFGKKIDNHSVSYESLDKTIALVDRANGDITPLKEGTVPVRITVGDVTKTIEIKVVADAKAAAVELDKNEISISNQVNTPEEVKVTVKDQYDNVFEGTDKVTVKVTSGSDLVTVSNELSLTKGVGTLGVKPADKTKSGKAVIEIAVSEKVKTTLEVEVTKAGIVDNYVVEGFKAELDKNTDEKNKNKEMTLSVFPVDADGVKTGDAVAEAKMTVTDKDGKAVTELKDVKAGKIEASKFDADETYTVSVKVGTIEVFKDSFKVVDTTKNPVIEQIKSSIKIESFETGKDTLKNALKEAFEVTGTDGNEVKITEFTYTSDNVAVIDGTGIKGSGTATLVISKVNNIEVPNLMVNVTVGTPFKAVKGEEKTVFTFGKFEAASGELKQLELDIYLGDNTGADRVYEDAGRESMNIPASINLDNLDSAVESVYNWANEKYKSAAESEKLFFEAIGYDAKAEKKEVVKAAIKENFSYENGVWTIKLANDKLSEIGTIEFAVSVTDTEGGRLWENNYSLNDGKDFKVFSYKAQ